MKQSRPDRAVRANLSAPRSGTIFRGSHCASSLKPAICAISRLPKACIRDLFAGRSPWFVRLLWGSYCNLMESAIPAKSNHKRFVIGDGRLRRIPKPKTP
jgi:hypothetical protein